MGDGSVGFVSIPMVRRASRLGIRSGLEILGSRQKVVE